MCNMRNSVLYFTFTSVLLLHISVSLSSETDDKEIVYAPVINTTDGPVRGKIIQSRQGKTIYAYLGIPYAKKPTDGLRFQPPRRTEPWSDVRDATKNGNRCPQLSYPERKFEGEEDCLYINVYTTRLSINNTVHGTVVWDVIVLIHGGGFTFGAGDEDNYAPDHLLDKDVVLVTFNYRLGALGFLATGDEAAPGNYGLRDQVEALRWVHRNIDLFSGNTKSITVLGMHAGGVSAHYHMLSPMSVNLIHGAISQSGTGLSPWAFVSGNTARQRGFRLGKLVGCKNAELNDTKKLVKCLKQKPFEDLVRQSIHVMEWSHDLSFPFVPVVDVKIPGLKQFLPDHPEMLIKNLKAPQNEIPWIIGVASHEGLPQALHMMVFPTMLDQLNSDPGKYLPLYLGMDITPEDEAKQVAMQIWKYYIKNSTINYGNLGKLAALTSDYNYFRAVSQSVALHSTLTRAAIFVYRFTFDPRASEIALGVPQGDDTRYLFPDTVAGTKIQFEGKQLRVIDQLVKLVTNFAQDGDPTPAEDELLDNVLWPVAEVTGTSDFQFIDIGDKIEIVTDGFYPERLAFWSKLEQKHKNSKSSQKDEL